MSFPTPAQGAYQYMQEDVLGLRLGIGSLGDFIETFRSNDSLGTIAYGQAIFMNPGDPVNGYLAHQDTAVITCSGSFTSGDSAATVTLNGTALTPVGYAVSSLSTGNAIAAVILAALSAATIANGATVKFNDSAHTFTIISPGCDTVVTLTSGGGVTATTAYSSSMIFMGISTFDQVSYKLSTGGYPTDVSGNMAYMGQIRVNASTAVNSGQLAYVIIAPGSTQGQFTNVAGSGPANFPTLGIFRGTTSGAGHVYIELRGKQNYAGAL